MAFLNLFHFYPLLIISLPGSCLVSVEYTVTLPVSFTCHTCFSSVVLKTCCTCYMFQVLVRDNGTQKLHFNSYIKHSTVITTTCCTEFHQNYCACYVTIKPMQGNYSWNLFCLVVSDDPHVFIARSVYVACMGYGLQTHSHKTWAKIFTIPLMLHLCTDLCALQQRLLTSLNGWK